MLWTACTGAALATATVLTAVPSASRATAHTTAHTTPYAVFLPGARPAPAPTLTTSAPGTPSASASVPSASVPPPSGPPTSGPPTSGPPTPGAPSGTSGPSAAGPAGSPGVGAPGPPRGRSPRRAAGRLLLVGDAAGYVDALTGEGVALALASAEAAVRCLTEGRPQDYDRRWRALSRRHRLLTHGLLACAGRPAGARLIVPAAARAPAVFRAAVRALS
ncbi:hypothetical protein GCM10009654_00930 [Streptomyces hebeiensis]|uniref:Monooxygenase n=1 Tax=Streptomyces hebeiensis TaxID=229486 RepID=A0ABN1UGI4_9ACTN